MKKLSEVLGSYLRIVIGCAFFGIAFNLFLKPHSLNAGGITGLSMIINHLLKLGTVGTITLLINVPLFAIGGWKLGKKFFLDSLLGMIGSSVAVDIFANLPSMNVTDPLLAALYGGVLGGLGLGMVFATRATTGGSDIIVRLLKRKWPYVPIGTINSCFDFAVVTLTGIAFGDMTRTLYCGVAVFVMGMVIDAVVYRFDYSRVALIISEKYEELAYKIGQELRRGSTFLDGEGSYSRKGTKVILTAVKRQQLADLKKLVVEIDPNAFIIVQEAHQVLGDGFSRYTKDAL